MEKSGQNQLSRSRLSILGQSLPCDYQEKGRNENDSGAGAGAYVILPGA